MTQLGSTATESGPDESGRQRAMRGSRLARRRRVLLGVGIAAALLAIGGLIGASFVKSPQQLAADTAAPPATVTTATVVSQILTSSVQMRGEVYPATQYDVYASASSSGDTGSAGGSSAAGGSSGSGRRRQRVRGVHLQAGRRGGRHGHQRRAAAPRSTASRCSR